MKTYKIDYKEILSYEFYVDAESQEQAIDKFNEMVSNGKVDFNDGYIVHSDIEYIQEV